MSHCAPVSPTEDYLYNFMIEKIMTQVEKMNFVKILPSQDRSSELSQQWSVPVQTEFLVTHRLFEHQNWDSHAAMNKFYCSKSKAVLLHSKNEKLF